MNDRFMGISRESAEFYAFKEEVREVGVRVNWWVRSHAWLRILQDARE